MHSTGLSEVPSRRGAIVGAPQLLAQKGTQDPGAVAFGGLCRCPKVQVLPLEAWWDCKVFADMALKEGDSARASFSHREELDTRGVQTREFVDSQGHCINSTSFDCLLSNCWHLVSSSFFFTRIFFDKPLNALSTCWICLWHKQSSAHSPQEGERSVHSFFVLQCGVNLTRNTH